MTTENDASPNGFEPPRPKAKRIRSILAMAVVAVLSGLVSVLVYSIFNTSDADREQQQQRKERSAQTDNTPLTESEPSSRGLAMLPPKPLSPNTKDEPAASASVPLTPEQEALRRDMEQIRRMKMQMHMAALQAPVSVNVESHPGAASPSTPLPRQGAPGPGMPATPEATSQHYDASDRRDKEAFLESRSRSTDAWTLGHTRQQGVRCELKTGTVIPGIMLTGINSDLPGRIIGQVSQNVYDTATGKLLLIPQGSRLFGIYDARVAVGQDRVLIAWNRIVFPDGSAVDIESMPGTDQAGYGGVEDRVNNHYFRIFGSAMIMSLISGGMAFTVDAMRPDTGDNSHNQNPTLRDQMGTALANQLGQASLQVLQQNVNIKPTLEIRPGFRFNIVLVKDLAFDAPYTPMR